MTAFGRKQTVVRSALSVRYAPKAAAHMVVSDRLLLTLSGHSLAFSYAFIRSTFLQPLLLGLHIEEVILKVSLIDSQIA